MDQKESLDIIKHEDNKKVKKNFRNSIISTIAFATLTIILFSAQTYAYFTSAVDTNQNEIALGNLDVSLIEMKETGAGETAYVNPVEILPATNVSKIVKVKNTGELPVYIRIKIEKNINKPEDSLPANWQDMISCDFNLEAWTYHTDGYYYYKLPLEAGMVTVPLFETVSFSSEMGNQFTNSQILFTVICEATQANGTGSSPTEAVGWPQSTSGASVNSVGQSGTQD